jgi:hypothetical protein
MHVDPAREDGSWLPEVGTPVRVIIPHGRICPEYPHFECEHGQTGVVVGDRPCPAAPEHRFLVVLHAPAEVSPLSRLDIAVTARHYAADELERVA